jgi:hypothetical protein
MIHFIIIIIYNIIYYNITKIIDTKGIFSSLIARVNNLMTLFFTVSNL